MLGRAQRQEVERIAESLSQQGDFPIDLNKIVKRSSYTIKSFSPSENPDFANRSGMIDKKQKIIYVNEAEPAYRQRFTIAHELGHLLLQHQKDEDYRDNHYSNDPEELAADYFAACLLMPKEIFLDVYRKMNLSELAAFFGVSRKAVGVRADEIFSHDIQ